jgi:hypothetical protein
MALPVKLTKKARCNASADLAAVLGQRKDDPLVRD